LEWKNYQDRYADLQDHSQAYGPYDDTDQPNRFIYLQGFTSWMIETDIDSPEACYCSLDRSDPEIPWKCFSSVESLSDRIGDIESEKPLPVGSLLAVHFRLVTRNNLFSPHQEDIVFWGMAAHFSSAILGSIGSACVYWAVKGTHANLVPWNGGKFGWVELVGYDMWSAHLVL
jgi:hypothetical protein